MKQTLIQETELLVGGLFKEIFGELTDNIVHAATNRIIEYETSLYKNTYYTKSFFHRSRPVPLYDFYIPLNIETFPNRKEDEKKTIKPESCHSLFSESKNITIIGTAGSGKSTLVKHVIINSIKSKFAIPLLIELRELNRPEYNGDLIKFISHEIFNYYRIGKKENIIEKMLFQGGFLFVFDGYDELSTSVLEKATSDIQKIAQKFERNYYLTTSRPYANSESLRSFVNYLIKGLNEEEQDKLITKLLKDKLYIRDQVLLEKRKEVNKSYLSYLENPLLLSLFIVTFEYHPTLPKKKSLFYEKVFQTLYEKHNSITKVNFKAEFYSNLSEDVFRKVLELFSYISYFQSLFVFKDDDISRIFSEINRKYPNIESSLFTKDALETVCIWFNDGVYYSFAHRSLQEYFAVKHIRELDPTYKGKTYDYLSSYFFENYNLIELIAENPDLDYYKKLLIPRIRTILTTYFKEIDGRLKNIKKLEKAYNDFLNLINIDLELQNIYINFLEKFSVEQFEEHPLITDISNEGNKSSLIAILTLNKHYSILEKEIENLTVEIVNDNSQTYNFTFKVK